jgi:hypothetical protein
MQFSTVNGEARPATRPLPSTAVVANGDAAALSPADQLHYQHFQHRLKVLVGHLLCVRPLLPDRFSRLGRRV